MRFHRLEHTIFTAPIVFTAAGIVLILVLPVLAEFEADRKAFLLIAEVGLVLTLFVDATRINLQVLKSNESLPIRLLGIGMLPTILLGAIGHPDVKPGILEKGLLLRLRFELDQYINLRPVQLYPGVDCPLKNKGPAEIDFVVVRENTEGLYAGAGGTLKKGTSDEIAVQESINTRKGVERCLRYAFEYTRKRARRNTLLLCGKTHVLTYAFDLWERAFQEVGQRDYPDIKREYAHVDALKERNGRP